MQNALLMAVLRSALLLLTSFPAVDGADWLLPDFLSSVAEAPYFEVWRSPVAGYGTTTTFLGGENLSTSTTLSTSASSTTQDQTPPSFPLQSTTVDANVANGVTHVQLTQTYHNAGQECLGSRYVFPLPSKAAISAMSMIIGNRTVVGQIRTKSRAQQEFQEAQQSGQSAALLEQERPNVFAMELANILPGDTVRVVVDYVETLVPIDGVFAFTFPTVVGPRYGQDWESATIPADSHLDVDVTLKVVPACLGMESDLPLQTLDTQSSTEASVTGANADIIVKFWFTERAVGSQLLISQNGTDRYFSLAIQPPQRQLLDTSQISPREYLFILDTSGSMSGYPIDLSKALMKQLLRDHVRPRDRLNILLFAGGSEVLSTNGSLEATAANVANAEAWLDENMWAGGGTRLLPALRRAFGLPRNSMSESRNIVIMTDGYVSVEKEAFDMVRNRLGEGNVFVFGIGNSVNRYLIEGLARVGYGEPFVVRSEAEGMSVVEKLRLYIDSPVLTNLELSFSGAFVPSEQEPPHLPDVLASRPIQVVGKWSGNLTGEVRLQGYLADGALWQYVADLSNVGTSNLAAVRLLWARSRIAILSDYGAVYQDNEEEVTQLGLEYSLLTQYTSFVAVDSNPSAPDVCGAAGDFETQTTTYVWDDEMSSMSFAASSCPRQSAGLWGTIVLQLLLVAHVARSPALRVQM